MKSSSELAVKDSSVKSASRTLDLLEFIARANAAPSFGEISQALGIPKSSLFHLLATLGRRGYLAQSGPRGGYRLGAAVTDLARDMGRTIAHLDRVRPILRELAATLNETVGYNEVRNDQVEIVISEFGRQALHYMMRSGERAPLYVLSGGKALLASLSDDQLDAYVARTQFEPFTPYTLRSGDDLRRHLDMARRTGFATSIQEYMLGIAGIATVLKDDGRVVGAINVAVPSVRYNEALQARIQQCLTYAVSQFECSAPPAETMSA